MAMSEDFKRRLASLEKQMRDPNSAIHIDGLLVRRGRWEEQGGGGQTQGRRGRVGKGGGADRARQTCLRPGRGDGLANSLGEDRGRT